MARTRLTDEQKAEIRKEFKGGQKEAERLGQKHGVHYTTIYGVIKNGKVKAAKSSPRRKTARKPVKAKTVYTDQDWETAFADYLEKRDQFNKADKHLREVAKALK